jgi:hypothetical protein
MGTKKILDWAHAIFVLVITLVTFIALLLLLRAAGEPLWSQEAAGWAQTVGSVAAIGASFMIANTQYRRDRALDDYRQKADEAKILSLVRAVFQNISDQAEGTISRRNASSFHLTKKIDIEALRQLLGLLEKFSPYDIPTKDVMLFSHELQHFILKVCELMDREYIELEQGRHAATTELADTVDELLMGLLMMSREAIATCSTAISVRRSTSA